MPGLCLAEQHPVRSAASLGSALALHSHPTLLSRKRSTSGVLKPKTLVLVADAGRLLHRKVIFKAQQNGVLWERGV